MKKIICCMLAVLLAAGGALSFALADRMYLIPDSDTRKLTKEELWNWDYESLGYIMNEIFARHGYVFEAGGKYEHYFKCMPWYTPNADSNNDRACYPQLKQTEWDNVNLIKEVREDMRNMNTQNKGKQSVWDLFSTGFDVLQGFDFITCSEQQTVPVYSAPDAASWRGANGKASVSTNGAIYAAGVEGAWLMVMYETNNGGVRVGYVNRQAVTGKVQGDAWTRNLSFAYLQAELLGGCVLTDDPATQSTALRTLQPGARVTYLSTFYTNRVWDYVETTMPDGQQVRGFIPVGFLNYVSYGVGETDNIGL